LPLEREAQGKLQVTLAGFVSDLAEGRLVVSVHAQAANIPVGMVDKVERFSTEFETGLLGDHELLEETDVPVLEAGLIDDIPHTVLRVKCSGGGRRENRLPVGVGTREVFGRVGVAARSSEATADRGIAVLDPELALATATEAADLADMSVIGICSDTAGSSGLKLRDAVNLPATQ